VTEGLHSQLPLCAPGGHEDGEELEQMRRLTRLHDCPVSYTAKKRFRKKVSKGFLDVKALLLPSKPYIEGSAEQLKNLLETKGV